MYERFDRTPADTIWAMLVYWMGEAEDPEDNEGHVVHATITLLRWDLLYRVGRWDGRGLPDDG